MRKEKREDDLQREKKNKKKTEHRETKTAKQSIPSPADRNPSAFNKWELGRGNGQADGSEKECPSPHSFSLPSARPFPFPSFPFDKRVWIFDLPAKEETVLQCK